MKNNHDFKYSPDNPFIYEIIDRIIERTSIYPKMSKIKQCMQDHHMDFREAVIIHCNTERKRRMYVRVFDRHFKVYISLYNDKVRGRT